MMWQTYFLKFPDQAAWEAAIPAEWHGDEGLITASENHAADVVGAIEDEEGFHVNVRVKGPMPDNLTQYVVTPTNPVRVFA